MNRLHRLGLASARHPWRTIATWVLVVVAVSAAATTWGGALRDNWDVPGARAQQGLEQVRQHFPASGGSSAQVVLHDDRPLIDDRTDRAAAELVDPGRGQVRAQHHGRAGGISVVCKGGRGDNAEHGCGKDKGFHHRTNSLQMTENVLAELSACGHAATAPASEW